ncbi:MAG: translation initiation factor IF-3 [Fimbriimonadales bacterium]|nr:MAG: translation initiation factor IF-3 [Fimbriimonadales bacterium]
MINEKCLRFPDVRLIDAQGKQAGIVRTMEALKMAREAGLDLVLVAPNADPPVCKIVDYGKHKYEQDKKQKEAKAKRKVQDVKGVKLTPSISTGDLEVRLKQVTKFLTEGHKVKFTVRFRSREHTHPEIAEAKLNWILERLEVPYQIDKPAGIEGRQMTMVISPGKVTAKKETKNGEVQDVQDSGEEV